MSSGVSFSTPLPTLTPPVSVPTRRHLRFAKRCLYRFLAQELDKIPNITCAPHEIDETFALSLFLPYEVFALIFRHLSPTNLLVFRASCTTFRDNIASNPSFWMPHNTLGFEELNTEGLHITATKLGCLETFLVLRKYQQPIKEIMNLLHKMKATPNSSNLTPLQDKLQVEELFVRRLKICSPWSFSTDVRTEMSVVPPHIKWKVLDTMIAFQLVIRSGFYDGEILHFHIYVPNEYPQLPPLVKSMSDVYHPDISEAGDVALGLLKGWNPKNILADVVLATEALFLGGSLTCGFTL